MGDRHFIKLKCAYCKKKNPKPCESDFWEAQYVAYAESSGITTFICDYCGKENQIIMEFKAKTKK